MKLMIGFVLMLATSQLVGQNDKFNIIFIQDFENSTVGPYQRSEWLRDWNNPTWDNRLTNALIFNQPGLSNVLKLTYDQGTVGLDEDSSPTPGNGIQFWSYNNARTTELYMSYNVIFKKGFVFNLSGKLPGLLGGPQDYIPNTKPEYSEGWSCMVTWDGQVLNSSGQPINYYHTVYPGPRDPSKGTINYYYYNQDQKLVSGDITKWSDPYSDDISKPWYIINNDTEEWINITLRVVMNTVGPEGGNYDGIMEGFIDGKLMVRKTDIRWRNVSSIYIDGILFSSFFGGSGPSFAAVRDEWALFDDIYLFTYADGVDVPRGNTPSPFGRVLELPNLRDNSILRAETDMEPPTEPTGLLTTDVTMNSIGLVWNASTDNVGVIGYRIFNDNLLIGATPNTSYIVSGLSEGTEYSFNVTSYDSELNESQHSHSVSATTFSSDAEAPTVPSGLLITGVSGYSIDLSWSNSSDNMAVKGYGIYLNESEYGTSVNNFFTISGLNPNTEYSIAITAFDFANNESAQSSAISARTGAPDNEPPSTPTGLRATEVTEKTISLVWNPSTDNVAINAYKISVNNSDQKSFSNQFTIGSLEPGLDYRIMVSALDEASNESSYSEAIVVSTKNEDITTDPALPTIAILAVQNNTIQPNSTTVMKSLGFAEIMNYGIEVTEMDRPLSEPIVLTGLKTSSVTNIGRVAENLQVLYNFSNGEGSEVSDISGVGEPMSLHISREGVTTEWIKGQGLRVMENTIISSMGPAKKLLEALTETNEITLEAWVKQEENVQSGPARIITLSTDHFKRAVTLAHEGNNSTYKYVARLNTTGTDANGLPEIASDIDFRSTSLHHVVFTHDNNGMERLYINGQVFYSGTREGNFSSWDNDYQFALSNEITGERPWLGIFYLAAVYNRALSKSEVDQNYKSGFGQIQFTTELDTLESNVRYKLSPFVRTSQGLVIGDEKDFIYKNVALSDSLLSFYPNPNSGEFTVIIRNRDANVKGAYLRIADFAGQVHYNSEIDLSEGLLKNESVVQLPAMAQSGIYSIILIAGARSVAEKLVLIK